MATETWRPGAGEALAVASALAALLLLTGPHLPWLVGVPLFLLCLIGLPGLFVGVMVAMLFGGVHDMSGWIVALVSVPINARVYWEVTKKRTARAAKVSEPV